MAKMIKKLNFPDFFFCNLKKIDFVVLNTALPSLDGEKSSSYSLYTKSEVAA
jgi:hypothetical protein